VHNTEHLQLMPTERQLSVAFAKLRKVIIKFVIFVRPHGTLLPLDGFSGNLIFVIFRKSVEEIQVSLKSDKNSVYFTRRPMHINNDIGLNSSKNEKYFGQKM
jgi:hypothetical protein